MANENFALDLDLFDVQKSGYVPQEETRKNNIEKLKLLKPKTVTRAQFEEDIRESRVMAVRACVFALVALLMVGSLIFCRVAYTERQYELAKAQNDLSISQAYGIELRTKLNAMYSVEKIKEYAESKLGMVERDSYQISYFDISGEGGAQLTQ